MTLTVTTIAFSCIECDGVVAIRTPVIDVALNGI
jgi:hypothetical protein